MRIAQIAPLFESVPPKFYGGTERVVHNLTRGLAEKGNDVTLFCSGDSAIPGRKIALCPEALRLKPHAVEDPMAYQIKMLEIVASHAREFDVIHNHYDYPLFPLGRMTGTPLVSTMHGRMDLADLPVVFEAYPYTPLVSISEAQRKPLPDLNWVSTVYHGIDAATFGFFPRAGGYLAFLGRISPEKCPHHAIEIARKTGVPLKIAAKIENKDRDFFEARVRREIDGKFIEYIGEISESEKSEFLGNALALVFPIRWPEPFGLVMIESMACGTPVLTRAEGSVPEIMVHGKTGFVHDDLDLLARSVDLAAGLDRRAIRGHVERHFSIQRMTEGYLNVYAKLRQTRGKPRSHVRRVA